MDVASRRVVIKRPNFAPQPHKVQNFELAFSYKPRRSAGSHGKRGRSGYSLRYHSDRCNASRSTAKELTNQRYVFSFNVTLRFFFAPSRTLTFLLGFHHFRSLAFQIRAFSTSLPIRTFKPRQFQSLTVAWRAWRTLDQTLSEFVMLWRFQLCIE